MPGHGGATVRGWLGSHYLLVANYERHAWEVKSGWQVKNLATRSFPEIKTRLRFFRMVMLGIKPTRSSWLLERVAIPSHLSG